MPLSAQARTYFTYLNGPLSASKDVPSNVLKLPYLTYLPGPFSASNDVPTVPKCPSQHKQGPTQCTAMALPVQARTYLTYLMYLPGPVSASNDLPNVPK